MSGTQLCAGKDQRWSGYKSDVKLPPRLTEGLFGLNYFHIVELDTVGIIACLFFMSRSVLVKSLSFAYRIYSIVTECQMDQDNSVSVGLG